MWNSDNLGLTSFLGNLKVVLLNSISSDEKTSKFIKTKKRIRALTETYLTLPLKKIETSRRFMKNRVCERHITAKKTRPVVFKGPFATPSKRVVKLFFF